MRTSGPGYSSTPPPNERYWRGPVLHDFDGRTWRPWRSNALGAPPLQPQSPAYRYTVSLEPHEHNWIFSLDWPSHWNLPGGFLTGDYTLVQRGPVSHPLDVEATSYTRVQTSAPLSDSMRLRDTKVAPGRNPRSAQFARTLRSELGGVDRE